jgi:endo-1,4-beta-D-glucanase Y
MVRKLPISTLRFVFLVYLVSLTLTVHAQATDLIAPPEIPGDAVYVPYPVHILIDGDLSDWAGIPVQTVTKGPYVSSDPAENGSFTFAVAADSKSFYITMSMSDAHIVTGKHGANYWNEDSLEFYLNLSSDLAGLGYVDGIAQFNVNAGDIGNSNPTAITVTGRDSDSMSLRAMVFRTQDGWGFEGAVALDGRIVPTHGQEIGFQAQANGATMLDRDVKMIWSNADSNDSSWQNPSVFGRALFFKRGSRDIPQPSVIEPQTAAAMDAAQWHNIVVSTWEGYKRNYIFCGAACGDNMGLVFDPSNGYQAVSEGVGYGMLMAVMLDDQATFDTIYDAAHEVMLDPGTGLLNWRADNTGAITGEASATDAEEDIAAALIFAQKRVERGEWHQHATQPYDSRARELLDSIYLFEVVDGRYLLPGDSWLGEGRDIINLSYFAPAWYRIYDDFEGGNRWRPVLDKGYNQLYATRGKQLGLAPDWSTSTGRPAYDYCDAEGRPREECRYEMTFDGIRVPWRVGLDCLWNGEPRACEWSQRSAAFLNSLPQNEFARMYDMDGAPVIDYQNELTTGMWLVAALAAQDSTLTGSLSQQLYNYAGNTLSEGYWGGSSDFYYNQSLAWFGASLLSGDFRNLYAET